MNKFVKTLLLILLIVALTLTVVACQKSGEEDKLPEDNDGSGAVPGDNLLDKAQVFGEIRDGLVLSGSSIATANTRFVTSEYSLVVNQINTTITYEAQYNESRNRDSVILLRVYDNQFARNVSFVYYDKGDLYYEILGQKRRIEGFGNTSSFDLFYDIVTMFDLGGYFYSEEFAEAFNSLSALAESKKISMVRVSETRDSYTIKEINMDELKPQLNKYIRNYIRDFFGSSLDAVTNALLGFRFSDLGAVEVGQLTAQTVDVIMDYAVKSDGQRGDGTISSLKFDFGGMQNNNIYPYRMTMAYACSVGTGTIELGKFEDPAINNYDKTVSGQHHFKGELYLPYFDETFSADIKMAINTVDNKQNQLIFGIRQQSDNLPEDDPYYRDREIAMAYYTDEILYADIDGLMKYYLGKGFDLETVGFPKVKFTGIDLTQQFANLMNYVGSVFDGADEEGILDIFLDDFQNPDSTLKQILSKLSSEENGNLIKFVIDSELIGDMIGDYTGDLTDWIASQIGVDPEIITALAGADALQSLRLEVTYRITTGEIGITGYTGDEAVFVLNLVAQEIGEEGLTFEYPDTLFDGTTFKDFDAPESVNLHLEGDLAIQGTDETDFSRFFGALMGDESGVNTKTFFGYDTYTNRDKLTFSLDIWNSSDLIEIAAVIFLNGDPFIRIHSAPSDLSVFLIENVNGGIRYRISRQSLMEAFDRLLGENNIFASQSIMDIFRVLSSGTQLTLGDEYLSFGLSPYYNEDSERVDPIFELIGVSGLVATFKARIYFSEPEIEIDESTYVVPKLDPPLETLVFNSIYEAYWHDAVHVSFGGVLYTFRPVFTEESTALQTGVQRYQPLAYLFGLDVTYIMLLGNSENPDDDGTKVVDRLGIERLTIDPSRPETFPERIEVLYAVPGGYQTGYLPYKIVDFEYTRETIKQAINSPGLPLRQYRIVIGKGSIAEAEFELDVEVLSCLLDADTLYGDRYNVPIVAKITVDPYDYAIKKQFDPSYDPIASALKAQYGANLKLHFLSNEQDGDNRVVTVDDFDWGFILDNLTYHGGTYYAVQSYNGTVPVQLEVVVPAKEVSHVQIVYSEGFSDVVGAYTVDILLEDTFRIPAYSDDRLELRVYFKTGRYRVIGSTYNADDPLCDGNYPFPLEWKYETATVTNISGSLNPLYDGISSNAEKDNVAQFGTPDVGGTQKLVLTVLAPTRSIPLMSEPVTAITHIAVNDQGEMLEGEIEINPIFIAALGFGEVNGEYFRFDPYEKDPAKRRLPSTVYADVTYAGQTMRRAYPIRWVTVDRDGRETNLITADGDVRFPMAEEAFFAVYGYIGTGALSNEQCLAMIIHNIGGAYESITMEINGESVTKPQGERFSVEINPYDRNAFPSEYILYFGDNSSVGNNGYMTVAASWMIETADGTVVPADQFYFPYSGGQFTIFTTLEADPSQGILAQRIELDVIVLPSVIVNNKAEGVGQMNEDNVIVVDTYSADSYRLYLTMEQGIETVGVYFEDGRLITGVPVEWENMDALLTAMTTPEGSSNEAGGILVLKGKVYAGTALEQSLAISYRIDARVVRDLTFTRIEQGDLDNGVLSVETDIEAKTIDLTIEKPFVLKGQYLDEQGRPQYGQLLPDQYLTYIFETVRVRFGDTSSDYRMQYALPDGFRDQMFSPTLAETRFTIEIEKLSGGSCIDSYVVNLVIVQDKLVASRVPEGVETFNTNGTLKYTEGYTFDPSVTVEYRNSGSVTYTNLVWRAVNSYGATAGGAAPVIIQGQELTSVPSSLFNALSGRQIQIVAELPGPGLRHTITRTLDFYAKNIQKTNYEAASSVEGYSVRNGNITINNVYAVYPFNVANLPTVITPNRSSTYIVDAGNEITFTISWIPADGFKDGQNGFDQDKINAKINSAGLIKTLLATAVIKHHNTEQTIELYITVAPLEHPAIRHDHLAFTQSEDSDGKIYNDLSVDPYLMQGNPLFVEGAFRLPKDIVADFGSETFRFDAFSAITYRIYNQETKTYEEIESIPYNYLGHCLGAAYGQPTDALPLIVVLPDGKEGLLRVSFEARELDYVTVRNNVTKALVEEEDAYLKALFYVDPYNPDSHVLPGEIKAYYRSGAFNVLPVSYVPASDSAPFILKNGAWVFDPSAPDAFEGGQYVFNSALTTYVGDTEPQEFSVTVIVLDRSLKVAYTAEHRFDNPIAALLQDIPSALTQGYFEDLSDPIYGAFHAIAEPVLPAIEWDAASVVWDDPATFLVYEGFPEGVTIPGRLLYEGIRGEGASITVYAPRWTFSRVEVEGNNDNIIDFNPYTLYSIQKEFTVVFLEDGNEKSVTFYTKEAIDNEADPLRAEQMRKTLIDWGTPDENEETFRTVILGNDYKSGQNDGKIVVENVFRFHFEQLTVTEIDLGFGFGASGFVDFVIDPLNPVIPTKATIRGKIVGDDLAQEMVFDDVTFEWLVGSEGSVSDYLYEGGVRNLQIRLSPRADQSVLFGVRVHYLNRTPIGIYTSVKNYSSSNSPTLIDSRYLYPLMIFNQGGGRTDYFRIDPLDTVIYNTETGLYNMPEEVVLIFDNTAQDQDALLQTALDRFGRVLYLNGLSWTLEGEIKLEGTTVVTEGTSRDVPIVSKMDGMRVGYRNAQGEVVYSDFYRYDNNPLPEIYRLKLSVQDSQVQYTSISTGYIGADGLLHQDAMDEYYIDPYEIKFPSTVTVTFKGQRELTFENIVWTYDEDILEKPGVISGNVAEGNPDALKTIASFKIYGTELKIRFPIRPRKIDIGIGEGDNTEPLKGGKIFVLKGLPLAEQLPTYLYYAFTYDGVVDVARAPLKFSEIDLASISTNSVGVYNDIRGTLGLVDKNNILFTIEVIDPVLYNIVPDIHNAELEVNGSFIFDYIVVARDHNNFYVEGRETALVPGKMIVNASGEFLLVENIEYDIANGVAYLTCLYTFLSDSDDVNISGSQDISDPARSRMLPITFVVPIVSYDYTRIYTDLSYPIDRYSVALGTKIKASDLPKAYDQLGNEYDLIWDMSGVNTNRAGSYIATGYYRNTYDSYVGVSITIDVGIHYCEESDIRIQSSWLSRTYTGEEVPIEDALTISTFLREDGTIGDVEGYIVEYSIDGGITWMSEQPVNVKESGAPDYLVRVTIDDYNVVGSRIFTLSILQHVIQAGDVSFLNNAGQPAAPGEWIEREYNGETQFPELSGVPEGAEYRIVVNGVSGVNPRNAGEYHLELVFPTQRNFVVAGDVTFTADMRITKKNVTYVVTQNVTYRGEYFDAVVQGVPETGDGVVVTYSYVDQATGLNVAKMRDVGSYIATIVIDGGVNYPSDVLENQLINVLPKEIKIKVNTVSSEYLSALKPLNSEVTIVDAADESLPGLVGTDSVQIFGPINVQCPSGLTYKHMVGEYPLEIVGTITHKNYRITQVPGTYRITASAEGAAVIETPEELQNRIKALADGDTVRWYLKPGHYGSISIDVNAGVYLIGSYDFHADGEEIAVTFDRIVVNRGAVTIDIVKMTAKANTELIRIGAGAGTVTVSRSEFLLNRANHLPMAVGVRTETAYRETLYINDCLFDGLTVAVYAEGGAVNISDATFTDNVVAVQVRQGDLTVTDSNFSYQLEAAIKVDAADANVNINYNVFAYNKVAIVSYAPVRDDVRIQNTFQGNNTDIQALQNETKK